MSWSELERLVEKAEAETQGPRRVQRSQGGGLEA